MVALSEEMIINRTRCKTLAEVKALNCWGSELTDVSIVQHMPQVEVLSLSVNKIASLSSFSTCPALTELYLRKNAVTDIAEISYLKGLKELKMLWLSGNPIENIPQYRLTVIRALPTLHKLDDIVVTEDEVVESQKLGKELGPAPTIPEVANPYIHATPANDVQSTEPEYKENPVIGAIALLLKTLAIDELKAVASIVKSEAKARRDK